jgi:hypothetical protein
LGNCPMTQKLLPKDFLKFYQLSNAEKSWYTCMFEDPSGVIVTQCLLLWSDQVIQNNEPTIFSIKSMIIIVMITAQWYFFVKILAILCYFFSTYAYSLRFLHYWCFFLYKIFKYLKDNEYICKSVQKKQASSPRLGTGLFNISKRMFVRRCFSFILLCSSCTHVTYTFGLFLSVICVLDFSFRSLCVIFSYIL